MLSENTYKILKTLQGKSPTSLIAKLINFLISLTLFLGNIPYFWNKSKCRVFKLPYLLQSPLRNLENPGVAGTWAKEWREVYGAYRYQFHLRLLGICPNCSRVQSSTYIGRGF